MEEPDQMASERPVCIQDSVPIASEDSPSVVEGGLGKHPQSGKEACRERPGNLVPLDFDHGVPLVNVFTSLVNVNGVPLRARPLLHPHLPSQVLVASGVLTVSSVVCRYCVVLLTPEAAKSTQPFEAFLSFAQANSQDTLRFMHAYSDRQPEFANAFLPDSETFRGKSVVSRGPRPGPDPSSSRALALDSVSYFLGSFEYKLQETQKSLSLF